MEILNQGLKVILTMKLISFEDLDYDRIIDDHQILSSILQPLALENGKNLISKLLSEPD